MAEFAGAVAIVTGGARGQGADEARMFVGRGARVVIADVADDPGWALAEELGDAARFVHVDVSSKDDWAEAVSVGRQLGAIRFLVNNAGQHRAVRIEHEEADQLRRVLEVNVVGAFLGMQAVRSDIKAAGGGAVVNISSVSGLLGPEGRAAYGSSKWALRGLTKVAAGELANDGIRVNCVLPGPVDTGMLREQDVTAAIRNLPIGCLAQASEIAEVVLFLCSSASSYMTGADVIVDGGYTAVGPRTGSSA